MEINLSRNLSGFPNFEYTADVYPNSSCGFGLIGFSFGMGQHDMHISRVMFYHVMPLFHVNGLGLNSCFPIEMYKSQRELIIEDNMWLD